VDDQGSKWLAAGIGAVSGAAFATAVTLAVVTATAVEQEPEPPSATALSVFERDASTIDDPANLAVPLDEVFRDAEGSYIEDVEDLTLRWVGGPDGYEAYAVRWHEADDYTVCLLVEATDQAIADCTPEADFILNGIRMPAFGLDLKWGPSGTELWVNSLR
jgi:hypothetical protein